MPAQQGEVLVADRRKHRHQFRVVPLLQAALRLVQQIRDEAHRFAITHHRKARSRARLTSPLTRIPGIGPTTARRLLEQFGSPDAVLAASEEALARAVGPARARRIREALADKL
ncbi:MAG: hypothetical protein Kow0062_28870 [Acidobacteriota bacterium]